MDEGRRTALTSVVEMDVTSLQTTTQPQFQTKSQQIIQSRRYTLRHNLQQPRLDVVMKPVWRLDDTLVLPSCGRDPVSLIVSVTSSSSAHPVCPQTNWNERRPRDKSRHVLSLWSVSISDRNSASLLWHFQRLTEYYKLFINWILVITTQSKQHSCRHRWAQGMYLHYLFLVHGWKQSVDDRHVTTQQTLTCVAYFGHFQPVQQWSKERLACQEVQW